MKKFFFLVSHIHELWDKVDSLLRSNETVINEVTDLKGKVSDVIILQSCCNEQVEKLGGVLSLKYDRIVDSKEAAEMLGTTTWVVCNACRAGDIIAEKNDGGRKWRIRLSEIQRLINNGLVGVVIAKNQKPGKDEKKENK